MLHGKLTRVVLLLSLLVSFLPQRVIAQQRAPNAKVWVNTNSGVYHCPGTRWYGATKIGEFMAEADAQRAGYRPAYGRTCGLAPAIQPKAQAASPAPLQEPAATECGFERWPVKILFDDDRQRVDLKPQTTSVRELISLPRPDAGFAYKSRVAPVEFQSFRVRAVVSGMKYEKDSDVHMIIADPKNPKLTMIAEVPHPDCALGSGNEERYRRVRQVLQSTPVGTEVELVGVGFFDREHGQTGAARNGIELHPVLEVKPITSTAN